MITPGSAWGSPESGPADLAVEGDDAQLAHALRGAPEGVLVAFTPSPASDVARAVGLGPGAPPQGLALPMDALELDDGTLCVNAVVLGPPPDRLTARSRAIGIELGVNGRSEAVEGATTVVVATGQWLRGVDLIPRGHPGDGRAEVQVYRLARGERAAMRKRLPTGTHLPHPRILTRAAVRVDVSAARPLPLEIDGVGAGPTATLRCRLVPGRYRLLI